MLYSSFRITVMIAAFLGILHMFSQGAFTYIFFPITILIWVIYSFFDSNDSEYLRRNGIDPDEISWFFPDYSDYGAVRDGNSSMNYRHYNYGRSYTSKGNSSYSPQNNYYTYGRYDNQVYKTLKSKCKRNFKITISKNNETEKS